MFKKFSIKKNIFLQEASVAVAVISSLLLVVGLLLVALGYRFGWRLTRPRAVAVAQQQVAMADSATSLPPLVEVGSPILPAGVDTRSYPDLLEMSNRVSTPAVAAAAAKVTGLTPPPSYATAYAGGESVA